MSSPVLALQWAEKRQYRLWMEDEEGWGTGHKSWMWLCSLEAHNTLKRQAGYEVQMEKLRFGAKCLLGPQS